MVPIDTFDGPDGTGRFACNAGEKISVSGLRFFNAGNHQGQFGSLQHNFSVLESSILPPPMRRERKFVTLADKSRDAAGAGLIGHARSSIWVRRGSRYARSRGRGNSWRLRNPELESWRWSLLRRWSSR